MGVSETMTWVLSHLCPISCSICVFLSTCRIRTDRTDGRDFLSLVAVVCGWICQDAGGLMAQASRVCLFKISLYRCYLPSAGVFSKLHNYVTAASRGSFPPEMVLLISTDDSNVATCCIWDGKTVIQAAAECETRVGGSWNPRSACCTSKPLHVILNFNHLTLFNSAPACI